MRRYKNFIIGALALIAAVILANYIFLQRSLSALLSADARNKGISALAHYEYLVMPGTIVLDLRSLSDQTSNADVFRVLLQFAEAQQKHEYAAVKLAYKGKAKFILPGRYFHTLGVEYKFQNAAYTMRTTPENVLNLDGSQAFQSWSGGALGVLGKQLQDFHEFHSKWYLDDYLSSFK